MKNGKRQKIGTRRKVARAQSRKETPQVAAGQSAPSNTAMASPAGSGVATYNGPVRIVLDNTVPGGTRLEPAL